MDRNVYFFFWFLAILGVGLAALWCYLWILENKEQTANPKLHKISKTSLPYYKRSYITWSDLLDPTIRANPHQFNEHLHKLSKKFPNNIIPVKNEHHTYLIVKYDHVKAMLTKENESLLSSNPFADNRLIAPNTMDFIKHGKIMEYIKRYYSNITVNKQINIIEKIIENIINRFVENNKKLGKFNNNSTDSSPSNTKDKRKYDRRQRQRNRKNNNNNNGDSMMSSPSRGGEDEMTAEESEKLLDSCDFMKHVSKQIVMQSALYMIGFKPPALTENENNKINLNFPEISETMVNELIELNDCMIDIVAPLGGIGDHFDYSIFRFLKLIFYGILKAFLPTIELILSIGIKNAWNILRPDLSILKIPNNMQPRLQIWFKPHLLHTVPKYFLLLNKLYCKQKGFNQINANSNMMNDDGSYTVLNSMRKGELKGDITRDEILVTIVQLMVNMTTANAIGNMVFRIADSFLNQMESENIRANKIMGTNISTNENKSENNLNNFVHLSDLLLENNEINEKKSMSLIEEVLRYDAPLQRLPRRCRINMKSTKNLKTNINGLPNSVRFYKNTNLILMIGAANCDPSLFENDSKNESNNGDDNVNEHGNESNENENESDENEKNDNRNENESGFEFNAMRYFRNENEQGSSKVLKKALTFGFGVHFCLGYYLVKREMQLTLKCLLKANVKNIEILHKQRVDNIDVGNYGFKKLHVKFKYFDAE